MEIYRMPDARLPARARVVALGFFDGMHIGHAALLSLARQEGDTRRCETAVFSFAEDGALKPSTPRLLSEEERLAHMERAGVDTVFLYRFADICHLSPEEFVATVLVQQLSAAAVVCGYNFRFGKGGAGDAAMLRTLLSPYGLPLYVLPPARLGDEVISASAIRVALAAGMAEQAARMLGRPYAITGEVAHGKALGRQIGVPTANLKIPPGRMVPALGVYAAIGYIEGDARPHLGVANIGVRPTVEHGSLPNCETHFLDPVGDIYGKHLTVLLLHHLRGEIAFENIEALIAQIAQDKAQAKEYGTTWLNGQN
jgi:riboflavin kinase/FMN adenylyltransferase